MTASKALAAFVALEHLGFFVLESFLFKTPLGLKVFKLTPQAAEANAVFAFNQGFYNLFLCAGLVWGLRAGSAPLLSFFLACVLVAGLVGGASASRSIWLVQALPAALALAALALAALRLQ
jgi:putative membrane protein